MLNIVATSPSGATARDARTVVFDLAPGHAALRGRRPRRRRQRAGQLRLSDDRRLPRRAPTTSQQFQVFDAGDRRRLPRAHARPDADVRQPARRAAGRRLRPRSRARRRPRPPRRSRSATTRSPRAARGAACSRSRASASASSTRSGDHARARSRIRANAISRYITFSVPKAALGDAGPGLGLHGRADRPGRLQPRPGARLPADAAGLPVRRRARRRAPTRTARSTPARCRRRWTCSRRPASRRPTSSTTRVHNPVTIAPVVMP